MKDVTPILELTYEQAMEQMLSAKRKGKPIEVVDLDEDYTCFFCGKLYNPPDTSLLHIFYCSERCDYLHSEQVDEAWESR